MPRGSREGPHRPGSPGPMECYYIVISSAHLSNGHFRNIKGVFRGPLSKNGDKTLDYAEKKNTIAKALEDLKANFYCALCDKQYYKHQEFDNHINSYDHAHKQRLKELKQREFARNVASKSRKDERKQEKALQRLHKLAELRKVTTCAPGSGPMFKSTTVTVRDNSGDIPQSAAIDSASTQDFSCTLMHSTPNCKDATSDISSTPENACSNASGPNKFGDQLHGAQGHRVGFSFAFPKKAVVKLESSAAVFYEYNDETSMEHGLSRRSRFIPGACSLQSPSATEIVLCPEEKQNCLHPLVEKCTDAAEDPENQESKELISEENRELENPVLIPADSNSKQLVSSDMEGCDTDVSTADLPGQTMSLAVDNAQVLPLDCSSCELLGNGAVAQAAVEDCSSLLQDPAEDNGKDGNSDLFTVETEIKKLGTEMLVPSHSEDDTRVPQSKLDTRKRSCEPFVPVLSKHGSNILQWPSEMLIYTSTDPSISYSCNPLYFDFRSSKASDSQEKPRHQANVPNLHHTTESNHSLVSVFTNKPTSECGDPEAEINKNVCDYTVPLVSDVSLIRSSDLAKYHNKVALGESIRIKKLKKHHISKNQLRQNAVIDEKHSRVWIKESHEKWLHKSRKRRKRRKLCHCHHHHYHPCGEATIADMEFSSAMEKEMSYRDENKHQHLQNNPEKCRYDAGNIWTATDEVQQSHQKADTENGHKRVTASSDHLHGSRGLCDIWHTKGMDQRSGCKLLHRKRKASSRRQLRQLARTCRRHKCLCSKTCCSWKVRRLSCSPETKCLGHCSEEKSPGHHQSIKRGYSFLTDELESSHRKRRQNTYSCSSDESSYGEECLAEEYFRQVSTSGMHHKAKGKHRRRKTRISHVCVDRNERSEASRPCKENSASSTLNILGEFLTQDNTEDTIVDSKADLAEEKDETMQLEEKKAPLPMGGTHVLEQDKATDCAAPESMLGMLSDVAAAVPEQGAPAAASTQDALKDEKKNENLSSHESPSCYKAPPPTRHLEQALPKSVLCHYELPESLPHEKINEVTSDWVQCGSGVFNSPPPLPFKEAHLNSHTFLATEQLIAPFTLPDQTLIFPPDNHEKFKDLPSEAYQQIMQQNMLANKVKFTLPPPAMQPPSSPLQPLPLQPPLCSTSVTTIHHTVLQQHAAASALKALQPHQHFLSQVPALARAPLPHLPVGPRLCPGGPAAFVAPPHLPLVPPSVLQPAPLAFSPLPHAVFPSLLSPHPAVLPLQPLF
ncbi:zinc finger protein 804A [Coturnix japonica]|nr:zinc finger protein 804A [Coturnix japonica]